MNEMRIASNTGQYINYLHTGDILSLWDVARNKIIGLSTLSIYYKQAKDKELRDLVKKGVDLVAAKHVNKIQKLLKDKGYSFPFEFNWEKKFAEDPAFYIPTSMIDDEEIAVSIREIIRLTLSLEAEALRNATDEEIRELMCKILDDDNDGYNKILALQRRKNWSDFPPVLMPH